MTIRGTLAEFSLAEIFQFLEHQHGTGLLLIHAPSGSSTQEGRTRYVWLQKGRIVASAERPDNQGLCSLITQRGWLKFEELHQIMKSCSCSEDTPIGVCLRNQGALSTDQLKLLFSVSVLMRVCALFKLKDGQFVFDTTAALPTEEMTGLSLSATQATLLGLRVLRDWTSLATKLPAPDSVLRKAVSGQPHLHLDSQEWQVWELMNGKVSLNALAGQLHLSLKTVQQIAYRLSMVDLFEEVPMIAITSQQSEGEEAVVQCPTTNLDEEKKIRVQNSSKAVLREEVSPFQPSGIRHIKQSIGLALRHFSPSVVFGFDGN